MAEQANVIGVERLRATLGAAARDLGKMEQAGMRSAQLVASDARRTAPKRTGRLSRSITPAAQGNTARVSAAAPYGVFMEYGTSRMRARPFMRPALAAQTGAIVNTYATETQRTLNQVKGA